MRMTGGNIIMWGVVCALWGTPLVAGATTFDIAPPDSGSYVRDLAELISPEDEAQINAWCAALQLEHTVPVAVVTIDSMGQYSAEPMHVETFARGLFEQWGNDPEFNAVDDWRRGVMLLISKGDRKARIELGGTWPPNYIAQCVAIMNSVIVPRFKQGDFSQGAVAGIDALIVMVRGSAASEPTTASPSAVVAATTAPEESAERATPVPTDTTTTPPSQAMQIHVPSNTPTPIRIIPNPTQPVYYERGLSRQPIAFGFGVFAAIVLVIMKAIGGAIGGSGYSGGGYRGYGSRHHHHYHGGGYLGGHSMGGSSFGGHDHGSHSGGISHGGGHGGSHGGGGGATGSW